MRIFAFGGTRYAERARVGQWPDDFSVTAEFEDLYPLPFGRGLIAYGAGVRDGSPFLIVRQRQNEDDRGGYAYTVLLDPGADVWARFEFNAARLLLAAQEQQAFWTELLTTPNVLATPAIIADRLSKLSPNAPPQSDAGSTRAPKLKTALLASVMSQSPIAVSARDLGADERLALPDMAGLLADVPVAFRLGFGWLMGGRPGTGAKFGCRLIVDDVAEEALQGAESALALGAEAASATETVARSGLSESLPPLLATPVHRWTADPARVVEHCRVLATLATEGVAPAQATLRQVKPDDALYADVRRAASRAIGSGRVTVSAEVAEWTLAAFGNPEFVPREIAHRTDGATLAQYLDAAGLTLAAPAVKHYALPPAGALDVWTAHIALSDPDRVANLVQDALNHLLPKNLSAAGVEERVTRVTRAALQAGVAAGTPLRTWLRFKAEARVWNAMGALITEAARQRVDATSAEWTVDYLMCASDPGGEWLQATHGPDAVEQAITTALAYLRDRDIGPSVRDWLDTLAGGSVRHRLPLHLKLRIADAAGGRWLALSQLCQLLRGDRFLPARRPDEAEVEALTGELRELAGGTVHGIPPAGATVDLERIAWLVGGAIPGDIADAIGGSFALDAPALKWLRAQSHLPAFETAVRRDWRALPPDVLEGFRAPALAAIIADLRGSPDQEEQIRDVKALCDRMPHDAITQVVEADGAMIPWLAGLSVDPRMEAAASDELLGALPRPLRTHVFAHLARTSRMRFEDLVAKLLGAEGTPAVGPDLLAFISADTALREEMSRSLLGQPWSNARATIAARFGPAGTHRPPDEYEDDETSAVPLRITEADGRRRGWKALFEKPSRPRRR